MGQMLIIRNIFPRSFALPDCKHHRTAVGRSPCSQTFGWRSLAKNNSPDIQPDVWPQPPARNLCFVKACTRRRCSNRTRRCERHRCKKYREYHFCRVDCTRHLPVSVVRHHHSLSYQPIDLHINDKKHHAIQKESFALDRINILCFLFICRLYFQTIWHLYSFWTNTSNHWKSAAIYCYKYDDNIEVIVKGA